MVFCRWKGFRYVFMAVLPVVIILLPSAGAVFPEDGPGILPVGRFSLLSAEGGRLPENWQPLTFANIDRHTRYDLVRDNGTTVVRARSSRAASGLIRKIAIDPGKFPVIEWRWKIGNVYQNGDVTRKDGDDYPARIYIAFAYDPRRVGIWEKARFAAIKALYGEYPPVAAINYIWGSHAPQGTRVSNPYTGRVKMVVVESGEEYSNTWITETRNIYQDYQELFGEAPPMISGVAIMTDSDNTGESAVSYYGDIIFKAGR